MEPQMIPPPIKKEERSYEDATDADLLREALNQVNHKSPLGAVLKELLRRSESEAKTTEEESAWG